MLIGLQIYLFIFLGKVYQTLKKITETVDILNAQLPDILENLRTVTLKAKLVSNDLEKGVKQVSKTMSIFVPVFSIFKSITGLFAKRREE